MSDLSNESPPSDSSLAPEHCGILLDFTGSTAIIRLNRPAQRNSLSVATLHKVKKILSKLLPRTDLEAIIITGTGEVFASGADIRELAALDPQSAHQFAHLGQSVFQTIEDARQLTIAAINGYCMGGGIDLALACDIRIASKSAVFAHPGAKRGIITGWGGTQRLPRLIGKSRALELFTTAKTINSQEALELGLVTSLSENVIDSALDLAAAAADRKKAPNLSSAP